MDRFTSMLVFVKVAELGSFAAAASTMEISAPMVGKHVRSLEQRLGTLLISRTTRRQKLTEFGKAYYERCKLILAELDAADALAFDHVAEPRGKLRITAPVHFGRHCVLPVLLELAKRYPSLEFDVSLSDQITDLAADGYDLAIRTGNLENGSGLIVRSVARQLMVVVGSPDYLNRHGEPQRIEDLNRHSAVVYRRSGPVPPWTLPQKGLPLEAVAPQTRMRFDDLDAIADAAVAGMGLAWLPYWLVHDRIATGALVQLLSSSPAFLYDVYAVWQQTPKLPRKIRVMVDALAAALPSHMAPSGD